MSIIKRTVHKIHRRILKKVQGYCDGQKSCESCNFCEGKRCVLSGSPTSWKLAGK